MSNVAIIIPVYKSELRDKELISFYRACKILYRHPIILVCPEEMDTKTYSDIYPSLHIENFKNEYFKNVQSYNRLMLSHQFYRRFKKYKYILIYQLDAYIFRDELDFWCSQDYDYIGAPWMEGWEYPDEEWRFAGVGNGGFSLRKTKSAFKALHLFNRIEPLNEYWNRHSKVKLGIKSRMYFLIKFILTAFYFRNNSYDSYIDYNFNEDVFWGLIIKKKMSWYKIPSPEIALKFAFELRPKELYFLNNQKLPMGCHGWYKYDTKFWEPFINNAGSD